MKKDCSEILSERFVTYLLPSSDFFDQSEPRCLFGCKRCASFLKKIIFSHMERNACYRHIATVLQVKTKFVRSHLWLVRYKYINEISDIKINIGCELFVNRWIFTMTTITHLPDEIITIILEDKNISIQDIMNFKSTCKRLKQITLSTKFWEKKCSQGYVFIYKYIFIKLFMFIYIFNRFSPLNEAQSQWKSKVQFIILLSC